jgi:peptidyl-tRNA hydrolase ICT1
MLQKSEGFTGFIPMEALKVTYTNSFGQDVQATPIHVTNPPTKVDLRFHLKSATWLSESVKAKVAEKFGSQLTKDGYFVVK